MVSALADLGASANEVEMRVRARQRLISIARGMETPWGEMISTSLVHPIDGVVDVDGFSGAAAFAGGVEEGHGWQNALGGDGGEGATVAGAGEMFPDLGFGESGGGAGEKLFGGVALRGGKLEIGPDVLIE